MSSPFLYYEVSTLFNILFWLINDPFYWDIICALQTQSELSSDPKTSSSVVAVSVLSQNDISAFISRSFLDEALHIRPATVTLALQHVSLYRWFC